MENLRGKQARACTILVTFLLSVIKYSEQSNLKETGQTGLTVEGTTHDSRKGRHISLKQLVTLRPQSGSESSLVSSFHAFRTQVPEMVPLFYKSLTLSGWGFPLH